jgi:hypothetical protein
MFGAADCVTMQTAVLRSARKTSGAGRAARHKRGRRAGEPRVWRLGLTGPVFLFCQLLVVSG